MSRLSVFLLLLALTLPAAKPPKDEVDPLALAAVLLQDGHPDRAQRVLQDVDLAAPEAAEVDRARYHTLLGLAGFKLGDFQAALGSFTAAVDAGARDPSLHVYRAQAAYQLADCDTALGALDAAGPAGQAHAELFLMRADCHWKGERPQPAFAALSAGEAQHGPQRTFTRARVQWSLALGLSQLAVAEGRRYLAQGAGGLDDRLFLAEGLLRAKQHAAARDLLEETRLQHGDDERVLVQLGHAWLGLSHPLTAAGFFARAAALHDPKYSRDAAEVLRLHGHPHKALRANGQVVDQKAKLRQRLALLLDLERFEALTALAPRLSRLGLLAQDEDLRFALAYGHFRLGQFDRAERQLRRLTRPELFERAGAMRQAMAECRRTPERCR